MQIDVSYPSRFRNKDQAKLMRDIPLMKLKYRYIISFKNEVEIEVYNKVIIN